MTISTNDRRIVSDHDNEEKLAVATPVTICANNIKLSMSQEAESETWMGIHSEKKPFVQGGIIIGLGLGGFFDGIVFHQILQFHNMVSSYPDPGVADDLRLNVMADGFFHLTTYVLTILGLSLLLRVWRSSRISPSNRTIFGSAIMGWGIFNVVEGIVNHHLLAIHHVWPAGPGPVVLWDVAFLIWGAVFIVGGYKIVQGGGPSSTVYGTEQPPEEQASPEQTGQ